MTDVEKQVAWEQRWRQPVCIASIATAVLLLGSALGLYVGIAPNEPRVGLLQGLSPALHGLRQAAIDPRSAYVVYIDHHTIGLLASAIVTSLGTIATAIILVYLAVAARFRSARGNAFGTSMAISGPIIAGLAQITIAIIDVTGAHHFVTHADRSHSAVEAATNSTAYTVAWSIGIAGSLSLLLAFVLVCRGAMKVGLVPRFIGWMGVASGVFFVLPLQLPLVPTFWFVGIGVYLSGWANNVLPAAWEAGEARPLPTQLELREAREQAKQGARKSKASAPAPAPVAPTTAGSAPRKRKRKRR